MRVTTGLRPASSGYRSFDGKPVGRVVSRRRQSGANNTGGGIASEPNSNGWVSDINSVEGVVNHVLARRIQVRFDRSEAVPPTDGHHNSGIHLFVDEQALGEPAAKVMTGDLPKVFVAGLLGSSIGRPSDHGSDA